LWGLPVTATEEDRLLWAAEHPGPALDNGAQQPLVVGVLAAQRAMWELLAAACEQLGWRAVWLRPDCGNERPAVILWDHRGDRSEESQLASILAAQSDRPPVLALVTFPRAGDLQRLSRLGVTMLIGKPFRLDELGRQLQSVPGSVERAASRW
jgi:AmiR/NasT family two-component response regulator